MILIAYINNALRIKINITMFDFFKLQVLSWLCKKGEDILSKHAQHIATNLTSARLHEREFEKFYFTSMVSNVDCPIAVNGIERRAPRGIELLS